jgi:hypothetical protein
MPLTTLLQQSQPQLGLIETKNTAQRERVSISTGGMDIDDKAAAPGVKMATLRILSELPKVNDNEGNQAYEGPHGVMEDCIITGIMAHISRE